MTEKQNFRLMALKMAMDEEGEKGTVLERAKKYEEYIVGQAGESKEPRGSNQMPNSIKDLIQNLLFDGPCTCPDCMENSKEADGNVPSATSVDKDGKITEEDPPMMGNGKYYNSHMYFQSDGNIPEENKTSYDILVVNHGGYFTGRVSSNKSEVVYDILSEDSQDRIISLAIEHIDQEQRLLSRKSANSDLREVELHIIRTEEKE